MGKNLIITEKPSVARDFARVLKVSGQKKGYIENDEYVISWCYGHLVEMLYPESYDIKYKSWHLEDLPFLPDVYKYGVVEGAKDQYQVVNNLLHRNDIDVVYWAGDSGKEGQTIEENIRIYGGVREGMIEKRVWIDSQTDDEILRGIREARPMSDYARLGKSGIMRTIEDYSLGINFSRALSVKYGKLINDAAATKNYTAIAIGRVMTCVLGMVVRREREIRDFVETPFYKIQGLFSDIEFSAEWKAIDESEYVDSPLLYKENGFKKEADAQALIDKLSQEDLARVKNLEKGESKKKAPLLFNLAELQSECSKIFKISPNETLQIVQDLYERKYTTYPRTDARVLSTAIAKEIKKNLYGLKNYDSLSKYATEILNNNKHVNIEKTVYTDDSKITDHYAIIPTGHINGIDKLDSLHKAVYELIAKRFLAIFYPPAVYQTFKIQLLVGKENFFSSAKLLKEAGYMEVSGIPEKKSQDDSEDEQSTCSKEDLLKFADTIKNGDSVKIAKLSLKEGKTSPPKRYISGNLILAMENAGNLIEDEELRQQIKNTGIGTSATRGEIIEKLIRINYLNENKKTQIITPEKLGEMIYEVVLLSAPTLLNPEMTASWEKGLEGIINGTVDDIEYRRKLEAYIRNETTKMITGDLTMQIAANINQFTGKDSKGMATRKNLGIPCPVCGGELSTTSFGYGCNNYYNKENPCRFSVGKVAGVDLSEDDFIQLITTGTTGVIDNFIAKNKKKFRARLILTKDESGKCNISFNFDDIGPEYLEGVVCPDCGGQITVNKKGYGCANFSAEDENSCKFFVGMIAQKMISQNNIKELLTDKKTQTIRGFKSKSGKKFDACLILEVGEDGKSHIAFDFENVEEKIIKDCKCPKCGGDIVKKYFGYGCSNYNRENPENGCDFNIGTIASVKLTEANLKALLQNGITPVISGFKSKKGSNFDAKLAVEKDENGKYKGITFVFDNAEEIVDNIKCPKCGGNIIKTNLGYRCSNYSREEGGCSLFIGKIASLMLTKEQVIQLITNGITEQISGFTSKNGNLFDAKLKFDDSYNIKFEFENN